MKRKLWLILGVCLMTVFALIACGCNSDDNKSSAKAITAYSISGATGIINDTAKTIAVTVPYGTNVTALVATFTITGKKVTVNSTNQVSGTTANNFTSSVSYRVYADNDSSIIYTVTVTVAPSSSKSIDTYSLGSYVGAINQTSKTIAITVPYAYDVTALTAIFTYTGSSIKVGSTVQVSGSTANNFTSPVTYIVSAADASTVSYTVTVTMLSGGTWTQKVNFGGVARKEAVGFAIGANGYIGTGVNASGACLADFWEYDSAGNTWTQMADFAAASDAVPGLVRSNAVAFAVSNKGYVGTGTDGTTMYKDFWEFDPIANTWTQKTDFGGTTGTARKDAVGFNIGTTGYVGTGIDASGYVSDFWAYVPATDTWTVKAAFLGGARGSAVGLGVGNNGYIGTGFNGSTYYRDFWEYNPTTNAWLQKANFGGDARRDAVGLYSFCGTAYVGLGMVPCGYFNDFWEYDPVADTWLRRANFGGGLRASAVGFSIGSESHFVGTGEDGNLTLYKDFWTYTP
jgi:hypothetical protein